MCTVQRHLVGKHFRCVRTASKMYVLVVLYRFTIYISEVSGELKDSRLF